MTIERAITQEELSALLELLQKAKAEKPVPAWRVQALGLLEKAIGLVVEGNWDKALTLAAAAKAKELSQTKKPGVFAGITRQLREYSLRPTPEPEPEPEPEPPEKKKRQTSEILPRGRPGPKKRARFLTAQELAHLNACLEAVGGAVLARTLKIHSSQLYGALNKSRELMPEVIQALLAVEPAQAGARKKLAKLKAPSPELETLIRSIFREEIERRFPYPKA